MANAVIILGAGSSADFGVPTLSGIFDDPHVRDYLDDHPSFAQLLHDVFWQPRGHDIYSAGQTITVEEMLTTLRDWEDEPQVPDPPLMLDLATARKRLYVLVERAVHREKTSRFGRHLNPLIAYARENFTRTTWASLNWDCIFEASYWYTSGDPAWAGGVRTNPALAIPIVGWRGGRSADDYARGHELLKLHGSVTWWLLPDGRIHYHLFGRSGGLDERWDRYDNERTPTEHPVILEPSYYKYRTRLHGSHLKPQWDRFMRRLVEADCVIIVGYSLPPADSLARSKLLTAFQVNPDARWILIDPGETAQARYRRLLGGVRLVIHTEKLADFNDHLAESLDEARLVRRVSTRVATEADLPF